MGDLLSFSCEDAQKRGRVPVSLHVGHVKRARIFFTRRADDDLDGLDANLRL